MSVTVITMLLDSAIIIPVTQLLDGVRKYPEKKPYVKHELTMHVAPGMSTFSLSSTSMYGPVMSVPPKPLSRRQSDSFCKINIKKFVEN